MIFNDLVRINHRDWVELRIGWHSWWRQLLFLPPADLRFWRDEHGTWRVMQKHQDQLRYPGRWGRFEQIPVSKKWQRRCEQAMAQMDRCVDERRRAVFDEKSNPNYVE